MKVVTLYRTKDERRQDIPRVDLNRVDFEVDEAAGILRITLDYTIRRTNRRTNMVYPRTAAPTWSIPSTSTKAPTSSGL